MKLDSLNQEQFFAFTEKIYGEVKQAFVETEYAERVFVVANGHDTVARAILYLNPYHTIDGQQAACIGLFEALQNESAVKLLFDSIEKYCGSKNISQILGPMNGSTWNAYRLQIPGEFRPYFLEPVQPLYYPELFVDNGYSSFRSYSSNLDSNIRESRKDTGQVEKEYEAKGLRFRNIRIDDIENELRLIGEFSINAFKENLLYSPITVDQFLAKYKPVIPFLKEELVIIAEDEKSEVHGLLFAVKDYLDPSGKTIIIKTLARRKDSPFKGLSSIIYNKLLDVLVDNKDTQIIHALMADTNVSLTISKGYTTQKVRSYILYTKNLIS